MASAVTVLTGALLFVGLVPALAVAGRSLAPEVGGRWDAPREWPVVAIHAVLLPTGKVLHFSYPENGPGSSAWTWDPASDVLTDVSVDRDLFCGGHSLLPDGRVLVTGGTGPEPEKGEAAGLLDAHVFDPLSESWTRVADMARGRWYPTQVALGDGRTLVASGLDEQGNFNPLVEIYDPVSGWQVLAGADLEMDLYPFLHLLPSGRVFLAGPGSATRLLDPALATWSDVGARPTERYDGTAVLLPPGQSRVMVHGRRGGGRVEVIDFDDPTPTWQLAGTRSRAGSRHADAVILPDGNVLVVGGGRKVGMFDPVAGVWTKMAKLGRPRRYHSTAILLPDGRVLSAGTDGEYTVELYSPPYLHRGPRPTITGAPASVPYGATFAVSTTGGAIGALALLRLSAVTHSVNMEQRHVGLAFTGVSGTLTVTAPSEPNRAPPGYYMLFALSPDGIPSVARMLRLDL